MRDILYRICPPECRGVMWLNNRWFDPVMPKYSVFFIPKYKDVMFNANHRMLWLDFLMTTHKKSHLYLFEVRVNFTRIHYRDLVAWEGEDLEEIVLPVAYLGKRTILRRWRVNRSNLKKLGSEKRFR